MRTSSFRLDVDVDRDGRHDGYLNVKSANELSPFGQSMVPITSIRNGDGPCIIVIGGCHGDEYEGQIIARTALNRIKAEDVRGQLIVLPAANAEAVRIGQRFSASDNGNLNTAFPGSPSGTTTQRIAHFLETFLIPRADVVLDIHSGGKHIDYFPSAMISGAIEGERRQRLIELTRCFGLPVAFFVDEEDYTASSLLGACDRAGVLNITAEIGGGSVSPLMLDQTWSGLIRLLHHVGVWRGKLEEASPEVAFMRRLPVSSTVCAPSSGLFEARVQPGEHVEKDQLAGFLHSIDLPWSAPTAIRFTEPGFVLCRRLQVATQIGDGLVKLAVPMSL
ncbi:succinylglutamate desuccinylase/aspartoacylase family protein [Mesorhizobium sp. B4-1-4]|uniref:succinylglutamate desuccinylase/aspartoacylase family protein n=1 Tax=Mesorhizobium sp. B4-1-4 TaxID=2589888 RepID=UPI0015E432C9|nr:succinylglutamate desuccinylase/aspartoacylase family protein [Mesorhizobium sp. B4-1-4]UCI32068.1 succinylglutamate desuccinylase/aspartoacylase family protein [Mesorhizobium sp. B4-1-4]